MALQRLYSLLERIDFAQEDEWLTGPGNSRVDKIESILRKHSISIRDFYDNQAIGLIEIE